MNRVREWMRRVAGLFHKRRRDAELEEELAAHLEMLAEQNAQRGMPADEARRAARVELGGAEQIKEAVREQRGVPLLESFWQDVRFGLRMLRKNPGFTTIAVLTLGLGVGVNASIFSIFDAFLFQKLPVDSPGQLAYVVSQNKRGGEGDAFSYADFQYIQKETTQVFSDASAVSPALLQGDGISINGKNLLIQTCYVSGNFFRTLGIRPALGRFILSSEGNTIGSDPVLVISYSFWETNFNGDPGIIGRNVAINGRPVTIIGVTPEGFHGATFSLIDVQGYLPLSMGAGDSAAMPGGTLIARLRNGVTLAQANGLLDVVAQQLARQNPGDKTWKTLKARSLGPLGPITGPNPMPIVAALFLTLAGFVLLLACVNLANLLLTRATIRRREAAVRSALGATRARLISQSLTETVVLTLFGGCFGMALGMCAIKAMGSFPIGITGSSSPIFLDFRFDWRVFAYALSAALMAGIVAGGVPAVRASGVDLNGFLHDGGRSTSEKSRRRNVVVIAQVAGSLMLLVVAGLFARSLSSVQHVDLGFNPEHVLNLSMDPNQAGYNSAQGRELLSELLTRVRALPGVESASLASTVPLGGTNFGAPLQVEGYQPPMGARPAFAGENMVTSDYFATMGIPILRARGILDSDGGDSARVAVINQAMAEEYWPHEDPVGKEFSDDDPGFSHPVMLQVVGVVRNSRARTLATSLPVQPYFYVPLEQDYRLPVTLQVRTANPLAMTHSVEDTIRTLAPMMPVFDIQTMTEALDSVNGLVLFKVGAGLAASLGALGLLLAIVGVYGVVSYAATQRTHEIGVRVALGAQRKQVLAMMLGQGCAVVGLGLGAGILASMALSILVRKFLLGVSALDPITYLSVSAFLAVVALVACYVPARRAMRVDPMVALRHE